MVREQRDHPYKEGSSLFRFHISVANTVQSSVLRLCEVTYNGANIRTHFSTYLLLYYCYQRALHLHFATDNLNSKLTKFLGLGSGLPIYKIPIHRPYSIQLQFLHLYFPAIRLRHCGWVVGWLRSDLLFLTVMLPHCRKRLMW